MTGAGGSVGSSPPAGESGTAASSSLVRIGWSSSSSLETAFGRGIGGAGDGNQRGLGPGETERAFAGHCCGFRLSCLSAEGAPLSFLLTISRRLQP